MNSLLATVVILLLILCGSLVINVFLMWYSYRALQQIGYYDGELKDIINIVKNFTNHLKTVYEMEMFYGDETLRHLIRHAKDITDVFDAYDDYPDEDTEMYDYDNDYDYEQTEEA